jgi:2'-deoxynucleoside 5'-phosphate N-hydrolase
MRIFFAGPLTTLKDPDTTKRFYQKLSDTAGLYGFESFWAFLSGTDPVKDPGVDPQYIYDKDLAELEKSNLMIAYIGEPTTGTGQELEYAREHNIPAYLMFKKGEHVSRMVTGNRGVDGVIEFTDDEDAVLQLSTLLASIREKISAARQTT